MQTLTLSLTALAVLASQANAFAFKNKYPSSIWDPKLGHIPIPDTTTPQVKQWVAAINMSAIPNIPLATTVNNDGYSLIKPAAMKNYCDWSYDPAIDETCDTTDIFTCPTVGDWGLSYDDGPTQYSPVLYDYLDSIQQKATLFYIGAAVYNFPDIAIRGCKAMHQIGLHTWTHHLLTTLTNEQVVAELQYTAMIIKEVCGFTPKYMRPPFGDIDARVRALMKQMGYIPVIWDYDTNDWNLPPAPQASTTLAQVDSNFTQWISKRPSDTKGHICLEHELYNSSIAESIKWLPQLKKTFNVMTVQACIRDPYPYLEQQFVFPVADPAGVNLINSTQTPNNANASSSVITGAGTSANPTAAISGTSSLPPSSASASAITVPHSNGGATSAVSIALGVFSVLATLAYINM